MAYSDFNLKTVKKNFELTLVEENDLFVNIPELEPSEFLSKTLRENVPLALASNTEKSRSEMIVAPILIELRRQFNQKISLFSGIAFYVDPQKGLNGSCDFIISLATELLIVTAPVITVVEAKREDLNAGLGQCVAEMVAAQIFNEQENNHVQTIYGAVTSGTTWKFLQLEKQFVKIDIGEYYLRELPKLLGILAAGIRKNGLQ